VSDEFIKLMYQAYKNDYKNPDIFYHGEDFPMEGDVYVPHSKDWYNEHKVFNKFNNYVINHFAQRHGIRLKPTYNMGRVYTEKTQGMTKHKDRLPCEISITLPISYDQATWPICVYDDNLQQHKIHLRVGDMLVYRGCDQLHSREDDNINSECIQHYFHYVNLESEVGSFYRYFGEEPGIWPGNLEKMVYNNDLPVIDENIKGKYLKSIGE
jgi:hypothetical protein